MLQRALLVAVLLVPAAARADAVGPEDPSVTCPRGSHVAINHCGTVCTARRCSGDADCRDGEECAEVSLCAEDVPYCGGWSSEPYEEIRGACGDGCAGDEECRTFDACVPRSASDAGGATDAGAGEMVTYGCGCRASGKAPAAPAVLLATLAAFGLGARGRRK